MSFEKQSFRHDEDIDRDLIVRVKYIHTKNFLQMSKLLRSS